jgi:hypothetical protein
MHLSFLILFGEIQAIFFDLVPEYLTISLFLENSAQKKFSFPGLIQSDCIGKTLHRR